MMEAGRTGANTVDRVARQHPAVVAVGRAGWLAKGVVYGIVGALAVPIALGSGARAEGGEADAQASQVGAIAKLAESPAGSALLWAVAAGLLLYVLWRLVSMVLPAEPGLRTLATRVGYGISAAVYTSLAWTAVSFARRSTTTSGDTEESRVDRASQAFMEQSAGRWLVAALGLVLVAIGAFFAHRGATAGFRDELRPGVGPLRTDHLVRLGQVGWCARAATMALIGVLLVKAAVEFSPDDAEGLDGALRRLAGVPWGKAAVLSIGLGLVVYGAYCALSTPAQRLQGPT